MCVQKGQLSKFCYRGNPTKDQTNGCDPGFCGLRSSLTTNLTDETIVEFGEAGTSTCEKCAIFLISPSEQEIQIERTIRSRGTCNWQRELNGALEIYAESNSSSAIEVIGAEMFVDKKEEEEKPKTWIAAPIVISVLVVVGLLILGIWCWKCKKDQKKDADVQKKPDTEKGLAAPRKIEENAEEKKMAYVSNSNEPVQVENEEGRSTKASWMKREKKCSRHNEQGCCQAKAEQEETAKKEAKEGKRAKEKPAAKKCLLDEAQQKSPSPSLSRILIGISEQFTKIADFLMMDIFDFPTLETKIQELIVAEIVHNSHPEDRIQFSLTSRNSHELVKATKPKKIIKHLTLRTCNEEKFSYKIDSKSYHKYPDHLIGILRKCQIETLELYDESLFSKEHRSKHPTFLKTLLKASKFITKLIIAHHEPERDGFLDFYGKLKHLDYLDLDLTEWKEFDFPYFPTNVKLKMGLESDWILFNLAEKTKDCPLSYLYVENLIELNVFQHFLETASFKNDCKFLITTDELQIFMTFIEDDLFEIEIFPSWTLLIDVEQHLDGQNKRFIKLKETKTTHFLFDEFLINHIQEIPFTVTSASNPDKIYSGIFRINDYMNQEYFLKNVDRRDWIKINFESTDPTIIPRPHYSRQILQDFFPLNEATTSVDYLNVATTAWRVIKYANL
uniref:Uncharacterized protein n=1 Tax=Panagrolaimus sp. JU765 TaxID=591449 RepID=A0AC34R2R8_9BILA